MQQQASLASPPSAVPVRTALLVAAALLATAVGAQEPADAELKYELPGARMTLIAEHPQVATPTGIDVDSAGNVWVVSSHTHFRPPQYEGPEHDEVVVIGGEGRRVFYRQTTATMDLELGDDGWVYLAERSRLLRVRDSDGDGVGDQHQDLALLSTEADYPHNGLAGLAWTGDGRLIFALGENYATDWKLTGADGASIVGSGEGGIFRCRADGTGLQRLARGFWNPFGVCAGASGEIFAAENDPGARPPCRLLHVIEGGDYGYQRHFGPAPFHPFVCWDGALRGALPMVTAVGEAPCGVAPLGGGLLVTSWADHRVDYYPLAPAGASFRSQRRTLVRGGEDFRPTCIAAGRPGEYYLSDWTIGTYEIHGKGRVWKLEIDAERASWIESPAAPADARRLASELRAGSSQLLDGPPAEARLRLLRLASDDRQPFVAQSALLALSRMPESLEVEGLAGLPDELRPAAALAVKFHFYSHDDRRGRGSPPAKQLRELWLRRLLADDQAAVRFEALRWIAEQRLEEFRAEVRRAVDDPSLDFRMFEASLAAWNSVNGNARAGVSDPQMLLQRALDEAAPPRLRAYALRLIDPARRELTVDKLAQLARGEDPELAREAVRSLAGKANAEARRALEEICLAPDFPRPQKLDAIVGLAAAPGEHWQCLSQLAVDRDPAIRGEALRALRFAEHPEKESLLKRLAAQEPESREAIAIAAAADPQSLARPDMAPDDLAAWRRRLEEVPGAADVEAGRRIFFHSAIGACANCHRHRGRGNVVGPDLSAASRSYDQLLQAVLQPSRDVAPQYHPWQLVTSDGVVFTGIMLRKGGRNSKEFYRDNRGRERGFLKSEIARRQEVETSMMPDKLVDQMTDREFRDLLAFLMSGDGQ